MGYELKTLRKTSAKRHAFDTGVEFPTFSVSRAMRGWC